MATSVEALRWSFRKWTAIAVVSVLGLLALAIYMRETTIIREFEDQKATGLGAVLSGQPLFLNARVSQPAAEYLSSRNHDRDASQADRKLIHRGAIRASAGDPEAVAGQLQQAAEELGGYVAELRHAEQGYGRESRLDLRIPAPRFAEMRQRVRESVTEVTQDTVSAQDVTKEYFDLELTLRNYRAEEEQYLAVMKRATAVKDILEVSKHLAEVRGRIHKAKGELRFLAHQVEMAALSVTLTPDEAAKVFGVRWRPLVRLKEAFYDGVEAVGEFGSMLAGFVFLLPAILLWVAFLAALAYAAWRLIRAIVRRLAPKSAKDAPAAAPSA